MRLKDKRILFLSASLFGYQTEIKCCIERSGAVVDYFDERPSNTFFVKAMIRINRNFLATYIDNYHKNIIDKTINNRYDFIFITKGESISTKTILLLKQTHPEAKLVIYHWDSIANNKNAIAILPFFDKVFSFDKFDCEKLGIEFLPLFYLDDYKGIGYSVDKMDIDLLFIGTAHSDRYRFIMNISEEFKKNGLKSFLYIYFPSPLLYYKMKLSDKALRGTKSSEFKYIPLLKNQIIDFYSRSRIIVDAQHPQQTGLTMRSIEVLGARRKLITTNKDIVNYDFYNKNNILVVDRKNPVIDFNFVNSPFQDISENIYNKYLIDNWVNTILK